MILLRQSTRYTTATPWELQREDANGAHVVVGYFAEKPAEASLPDHRAVKRDADPKAKNARKRRGGA